MWFWDEEMIWAGKCKFNYWGWKWKSLRENFEDFHENFFLKKIKKNFIFCFFFFFKKNIFAIQKLKMQKKKLKNGKKVFEAQIKTF